MTGDLGDLANFCNSFSSGLSEQASEAAKQAALDIVTDLTLATPVDTSNALSNWQVTINSPATGVVMAYSVGIKGSTQLESAVSTVEAARKALASKKPGDVIFITNNAPYIVRLNDGWSKQAPAGFIDRAVMVTRASVGSYKVSM